MEIKVKLCKESIEELAKAVHEINSNSMMSKKNTIEKENKKETYSVKEIASLTGKCKMTIRKHINSNLLEAKKIGQTWIVTKEAFNKYIGKNE